MNEEEATKRVFESHIGRTLGTKKKAHEVTERLLDALQRIETCQSTLGEARQIAADTLDSLGRWPSDMDPRTNPLGLREYD
jgi:hypothetical protein